MEEEKLEDRVKKILKGIPLDMQKNTLIPSYQELEEQTKNNLKLCVDKEKKESYQDYLIYCQTVLTILNENCKDLEDVKSK